MAPPKIAGLMNRSSKTPPLAVMTFCEGRLAGSVVRSIQRRPCARASGRIIARAAVAWPRPCFQGTTA